MKRIAISLALMAFLSNAFPRESVQETPTEKTPQKTVDPKVKDRPRMPNVEDVFKTKNKAKKISDFGMPVGQGDKK